jgi:hypothetical protein
VKKEGGASGRRIWVGIAAALILFAASAVAAIVAMRSPRTIASSQSLRASDPARASSSRTIFAANHARRISLSKQPLSFEPNLGQSNPAVKFLSRGQGYSLFLTGSEAAAVDDQCRAARCCISRSALVAPLSAFSKFGKTASDGFRVKAHPRSPTPTTGESAVVRIALKGAACAPQISGVDRIAGRSNCFIGNNSKRWHTDVPNYAKVELKNVYPKIDLIYHGRRARPA